MRRQARYTEYKSQFSSSFRLAVQGARTIQPTPAETMTLILIVKHGLDPLILTPALERKLVARHPQSAISCELNRTA